MLKDEPELLENMDRVMPVLKLLSNKEFKNRDHLPVVPKSGLCCRVALMLKDESKLLENICKGTEVLECFSLRRDKFKNPDYLPVLSLSGLRCRVALMLKDEPEAVGEHGQGDARVGASLRQ
jgi:hypothetical protein